MPRKQRQRQKDKGRQRVERWGLGFLALFFVGGLVAVITDSEILTWLFALSFLVVALVFLERLSANRYMGRTERRHTQSEFMRQSGVSSGYRPSILSIYGLTAMVTVLAGFVLTNKLTTPVHVGIMQAPWHWLYEGALFSFAGAIAIAAMATLIHRFTPRATTLGIWLAKAMAVTGLHCVGLPLVFDGLNVNFDTSPVTASTAKVVKIVPSKSYKRRASMELAVMNGARLSGTIHTSLDYGAFKLDMDEKYASFYWREGWLGQRYAVAYPQPQ